MLRRKLWMAAGLLPVLVSGAARAGVTNPDISVIGQPFFSLSDDPSSINRKRVPMHPAVALL